MPIVCLRVLPALTDVSISAARNLPPHHMETVLRTLEQSCAARRLWFLDIMMYTPATPSDGILCTIASMVTGGHLAALQGLWNQWDDELHLTTEDAITAMYAIFGHPNAPARPRSFPACEAVCCMWITEAAATVLANAIEARAGPRPSCSSTWARGLRTPLRGMAPLRSISTGPDTLTTISVTFHR